MPRKSSSKPQRKKAVSFEKRVMAVVAKKAETKMKVIPLFNNANVIGSGLTQAPQPVNGLKIFSIANQLAVAQGVEQEQRNGNEITNCRLRCRGLVESLTWDATTNPSLYGYEVHIVAFKKKDDNTNNVNSLKTAPANANVACDGSLINSMYPYNKDGYIIKKVKVIRMLPQAESNTPLAQPNSYIFKRFYLDIPVAKTWKYNDTLDGPSNEWTALGVYVVNGDGTINNPSNSRCQITMDATLTYDDF